MPQTTKQEKEIQEQRLEIQRYREVQAAMDEQDRIMEEIEAMLEGASDRKQAEKEILELWVPRIQAAQKAASDALDAWHTSMQEE